MIKDAVESGIEIRENAGESRSSEIETRSLWLFRRGKELDNAEDERETEIRELELGKVREIWEMEEVEEKMEGVDLCLSFSKIFLWVSFGHPPSAQIIPILPFSLRF